MRWLNLLVVGVVAAVACPALGAIQPEAEEAYARGDYATAFKIWLPLAEQGSPYAAQNIARMYERGEWVAEDKAMADEWYRRAAALQAYDASMASTGQTANAPYQVQATASGQPVGTGVVTQPVVTQIVARPVVTRRVVYAVPVYYPPRPVYVPTPSPPRPSPPHHHHSRRH